jgi:alpha-N-arabinofuranosidase
VLARRDFLRSGLLAAGVAHIPFSSFPRSDSTDAQIEVLLNEPLGEISPNIYGHFIEHLGAVIYDSVWVGEESPVANIHGIRKRLVDELRKIKAPVVRYPGGCFADSYDWRDGVGPQEKRPKRTNFWGGTERNLFGTNEFMELCRLTGCQPYLAANLRSLPAQEFCRWVEYCNSPVGSTTLAEMRAAAGSPEPFGVRFWGIGNESWGCGGNFTPQEYAVEFRRFATWVPSYGQPLALIASGSSDSDWNWTRGFLEEMTRKGAGQLNAVYGMSLHHYSWNLSRGRTNDWEKGKGDALEFAPVDWYELLREGQSIEQMVEGHWRILGEFDAQHHVKLIVDEWGPWYRPGSEATPGDLLEQTPTLRDAVFSAMTLDIFNRHPDKVAMANCAQLINCLNSLYLAHEDRFCVTPVGHVFGMYAAHQGGTALRTVFSAPAIHYDRDGQDASFAGLLGSASARGKDIQLTVVNPDVGKAREAAVSMRGGRIQAAEATVLTASDIHAHNTFSTPAAVEPKTQEVSVNGPALHFVFPAASVTRLSLRLN